MPNSIRLDEISPATYHGLRANVEEDASITELASSIAKLGVLHPLIVRKGKTTFPSYEIVCGHRRYVACKRLSLETIPCIISDLNDREALEVALAENIQRQTLNAVEEAEAFKRYLVNFGLRSISSLAKRIGKSEEYVSHRLLLLGLPKPVLDSVSRRLLKVSCATELIWLKKGEKQTELANEIIANNMSFRETRFAVKQIKKNGLSTSQIVTRTLERRGLNGERNADKGNPSPTDPWPSYRFDNESSPIELHLLDHVVLILRSCLTGLDVVIDKCSDPQMRNLLVKERRCVHTSLDSVISEKVKRKKQIIGDSQDFSHGITASLISVMR
ncbi:MAG: ParB/RepB/Spo0J family partition protein [archaeon]|nr:ParB/RepB/Spo0J family partition protein [archaeon]